MPGRRRFLDGPWFTRPAAETTAAPVAQAPSAPASSGSDDLTVVFDAIPSPLVLLDADQRVTRINPAAAELLGEAAVGRDLALSLRHPKALDAVAAVLGGAERRTVEVHFPVPVSRSFAVEVSRLPGGGRGRPATVMVLQEITVVKRSEAVRSEFVANVSHELRSPLSVLIGFFETLRGPAQNDPDARARFLDIMEKEALRMSRLIDDLLSLSKIETKEHVKPDATVAVKPLLTEVAAALTLRARETEATLALDCPDGLPDIQGDRDELVQVVHNLTVNAIKYGGAGGAVTIAARPVERITDNGRPGVAISVADTGEGIDQEHIPRLTERFYRVDKGRSRAMGGTGLGLAIVKHIVNRHNGRLSVESEKGEGTTFTVALPLPRSAQARAAE